MITDPLFYRLFETSPEAFFLVLGMPPELAQETATRYRFLALEFKETSHRADGVFVPKEPDLPLYFLEVQFYSLPNVYADILVKAYTYLKQHDPSQPYCAVVLFASRALEPSGLKPYQPLLDAGLLRRIFLDELPEVANAPLGLAILHLICQPEEQAAMNARGLIVRAKGEIDDEPLRTDLVQLIETVIVYKLVRFSREEVQAMLQIDDIRDSRLFREYREEVLNEERQRMILKLATRQMPAADIAEVLGLDLDLVLKTLAETT